MRALLCLLLLGVLVYGAQSLAICPGGLGTVYCFVDPCSTVVQKGCHGYPDAKCVSNYCGGCNAEWFDANDNQLLCH